MRKTKQRLFEPLAVAAAVLALGAGTLTGADAPAGGESQLEKRSSGSGKNRLELRGRVMFNVDASFGGIGGFPAQNVAGAPVGTRTYDDGFVLDDLGGNTVLPGGPSTDNWQYQNAGQVRVDGATTYLDMTISSAAPTLSSADVDGGGVEPGFDLVYTHELGRNDRVSWGLQASFGYTRVNVGDNRTLTGPSMVFTDSYDVTAVAVGATIPSVLPGAAPPPLPTTTGTLIPVAPDGAVSGGTTIVPGGAITTGNRELQTDIIGLRLGPSIEYSLTEKVGLGFAFGGVGAIINSEFQYTESTTIPGMGPALQPGVSATQTSAGAVSDTSFEGGAFVEASISARLSDRVSALVGGQYIYTGKFNQSVDTHTASLNLNHSIGVFAGLSFGF